MQMPHWAAPHWRKGLLERVQSAVGGQPFNGDNACAACLQHRHQAAIHRVRRPRRTEHEPHSPSPQPSLVPVR